MYEDLKEEEIVKKVGGRFKLSTLIQKRLVQLNAGSRPLVELNTQDKMTIAMREILEDKIFLDTTEEVRVTGELPESADGPALDLNDLTAGGE
jgi:DNA-directed RNA polymerase subunit omega